MILRNPCLVTQKRRRATSRQRLPAWLEIADRYQARGGATVPVWFPEFDPRRLHP